MHILRTTYKAVTNVKVNLKVEKAMASHSSTLAWQIPWTEEPGGLQSMGLRRVGHDWATSLHFSLSCIGEGNGNPLQCSCLENPRDREAWWAMGSHRVGHDWSDLAAAAARAILERKWMNLTDWMCIDVVKWNGEETDELKKDEPKTPRFCSVLIGT